MGSRACRAQFTDCPSFGFFNYDCKLNILLTVGVLILYVQIISINEVHILC
jgi:hypothetical protein